MTARLPLATVAALLALAAPAHAKGVVKVMACGADGCRDVTARAKSPALMEMGAEQGGPTAAGPGFVRLRITIGDGGAHGVKLTQLYVPARDLLAVHEDGGGWVWTTPLPAGSEVLRRAVRGVRPLPARRLPAAALRTVPSPAPGPVAVRTAGADGGVPTWAWALAGLVVVLGAGAARRYRRA
ncbi:MAG: hypothetical protein ACXVFK_16330 [Solirubrobacteraceae bacterium]